MLMLGCQGLSVLGLYFSNEVLLLTDLLKAALEKDKEKSVKDCVQLKASVTTLTAKVETLNKNIELQKQTETELQVG